MELDKILDKIKDEIELDLGEDAGKLKGAELKSYLKQKINEISDRDTRLQAANTEIGNLRKYQQDTSALFAAAAQQQPTDERRTQPGAEQLDEFQASYGNDPLFKDVFGKYEGRISKKMREEIIGELKPLLDGMSSRNEQLTRFSLLEKNQRDFRDAGEWPEGWNYQKAQEYAKDKGYWLPNGGKQYGMADIERIHGEVTEPIRRQKFEETVRQSAREEAVKALRAEGAVISMPQRSMGGGATPVQVKGKTGEEILSNALGQAGQDLETMRMLDGLRG